MWKKSRRHRENVSVICPLRDETGSWILLMQMQFKTGDHDSRIGIMSFLCPAFAVNKCGVVSVHLLDLPHLTCEKTCTS